MVGKQYYQANNDGTVEIGDQPSGPNKKEIITILEKGLTYNGWKIDNSKTNSQPYKFTIKSNDIFIELFIYCWRISNGGRGRAHEQRIQIGSSANDEGFQIDNSNPHKKCLLLGVYHRDNYPPIIVAWEAKKNKNHGASKSCFIDIKSIATALRDGFTQTSDNDGNIVCAFRLEFLNFYIKNINSLHTIDFSMEKFNQSEDKNSQLTSSTEAVDIGTNKIIYGAPGVGKSFKLGKEGIRVTFHPEYTYFEFVGGLKPGKDSNGNITYEFKPGPFLKVLKEAYNKPKKMHTLIIEEINRANTAAVFGDIFQLLDRDENGWSEYAIFNEEILNYLNKGRAEPLKEIKIPGNLNIFATMNSADQGVFVMDSAFKRRWEFEYLSISFQEVEHAKSNLVYAGYQISWSNFAETINNYLSTVLKINEDKLIGPYFIKKDELKDNKKIAYKLLIYLWDDVVRHQRNELFNKKYNSFSKVSEAFITGNKPIFVEELEQNLFDKRYQEKSDLYEE